MEVAIGLGWESGSNHASSSGSVLFEKLRGVSGINVATNQLLNVNSGLLLLTLFGRVFRLGSLFFFVYIKSIKSIMGSLPT